MTPKAVRYAATVVCVAVGIPGMIVSSITDHDGAAVTFGLLAAVASLCLIVVSAVPRAEGALGSDPGATAAGYDEKQAADVETRIRSLVDAGADEDAVRDLARAAVHLGRGAAIRARGPSEAEGMRAPVGGQGRPR